MAKNSVPANGSQSYTPSAKPKESGGKVSFACDHPEDNSGPGGPYASGSIGETPVSGGRKSRVNPLPNPGSDYPLDGNVGVTFGPAPGAPNKPGKNKGGF